MGMSFTPKLGLPRALNAAAERQLLDYILDWKKAWRTDVKKQAVAGAIRNLVMLGWMRMKFSESLPEAV